LEIAVDVVKDEVVLEKEGVEDVDIGVGVVLVVVHEIEKESDVVLVNVITEVELPVVVFEMVYDCLIYKVLVKVGMRRLVEVFEWAGKLEVVEARE